MVIVAAACAVHFYNKCSGLEQGKRIFCQRVPQYPSAWNVLDACVPSYSPLLESSDPIARSWWRCRDAGLSVEKLLPSGHQDCPGDGFLGQGGRLMAAAQPVLDGLQQQLSGSESLLLLADAKAVILSMKGDPAVVAEASAINLVPGADWSESVAGTNAIGTALVEGATVEVSGEAHYLRRNRHLNCVAVPISGADGALVGALAIASGYPIDQAYGKALAEIHAGFVEDRLVECAPDTAAILRLQIEPDRFGPTLDGLAAFTRDGRLVGCNQRARRLLPAVLVPQMEFGAGFATPWAQVLEHGNRGGDSPLTIVDRNGHACFARISLRCARRTPALGQSGPRGRRLADLGAEDPRMAEAIRRASRIADCDIPLLVQGETGSGKEWFAQAFHASGSRAGGPFVAVNCAAIPATLIEAELFGHVDGAFTGARRAGSRGKIREADGGTLFLDEIGDMPLALQAVLLRVLETRRVAPLGGDSEEPVDIALVCASHQSLQTLVANGQFRADLFFRLSGMTVSLPPLRERADFDRVVQRILREESPRQLVEIAPPALAILRRYAWPGNLRQLRNVLRLSLALIDGAGYLTPELLPPEILDGAGVSAGVGLDLRAAQVRLARETVERHGGNISAAARELGITRTTLYRKLGAERSERN